MASSLFDAKIEVSISIDRTFFRKLPFTVTMPIQQKDLKPRGLTRSIVDVADAQTGSMALTTQLRGDAAEKESSTRQGRIGESGWRSHGISGNPRQCLKTADNVSPSNERREYCRP